MLNSDLTEELAQQWSGKLLKECGDDEVKLVREAYTEAYARKPSEQELSAAEAFIDAQAKSLAAKHIADGKYLPTPVPQSLDTAKAAAIVDFCHAIFCSNEFLYID
jgi:hypothetical protein